MRGRGKVWMMIGGGFLIIAGFLIGAVFIVPNGTEEQIENAFSLPEKLEEEWLGEATEGDGSVVIPGQGNLTVTEEGEVIDANFCNPKENAGRYLMMFAIILEEKKSEAVYVSKPVRAGECAEEIMISDFEGAEAEAEILIQPYRIKDGTKTNNARMKIKITSL